MGIWIADSACLRSTKVPNNKILRPERLLRNEERSTGDEVYVVVDPPPQAASPAEATTASGTARVEPTMGVPAGTAVDARFAGELSSGTSQAGQRFTGYLATDLRVGEILAAPRDSQVYGSVVEAQKAGPGGLYHRTEHVRTGLTKVGLPTGAWF